MSNKGTRKGRLYGEKKKKATTVINFNVHGKLSSPASQVELMKEMCHMKASIATFQETKWHENREVEIKGLGKLINIKARTENPYEKYGMAFYISEEWKESFSGVEYISDRIAAIKFKILNGEMLRMGEKLRMGRKYETETEEEEEEEDDEEEKEEETFNSGQFNETKEKTLILVNIYAPTSRRTDTRGTEEVEQFYDQLKQAIKKWKKKAAILLIGGDFNSKLGQRGEDEEELMGIHTKGHRNAHGRYMIEFLRETKMFACNTAFQHRDHHKATWHQKLEVTENGITRTKEINNQIDYMLILQRLKGMLVDSRSYKTRTYESDHKMVATKIRLGALYPISQTRVERVRKKDLTTLYRNPNTSEEYKAKQETNYFKKANEAFLEKAIEQMQDFAINQQELNQNQAGSITLNDQATMIKESMKEAIEEILPPAPRMVGGKIRYEKDKELMRLSKHRAKLWEKFTNKKTSARKKKQLYKLRKTIFKQMKKRIQTLNDERYTQIAEELERSNGGGNNKAMYEYNRLVQRKTYKRLVITDQDGFDQTNPFNLLEPAKKHFTEKFDAPEDLEIEEWIGIARSLNHPITKEEVKTAARKLRNGRSPGPDGIPGEYYKYAGEEIYEIIADMLNRMMEKHERIDSINEGILIPFNKDTGSKKWEKTRPIILLNTLRKIVCHIILRRINEKIEAYLPKEQHGYRESRSTTEIAWATQFLKSTCEIYNEGYDMVKTDMSQAFDRPSRRLLMTILEEEVKLEEDELRLIQMTIAKVELRVKIGKELGETFTSKLGVPQGDGLSPKLFLVYMEYISRKYKEERERSPRQWDLKVTYADDENYFFHINRVREIDDAPRVCPPNCRCAKCQKQELIEKLPIIMEQANMKMNAEKTQYHSLRRTRDIDVIQTGNNINPEIEIRNRINRARDALTRMNLIWKKKHYIKTNTRLKLYSTVVLPHLTYNTHAVPLTQAETDILERQHRKHLRKILGIFYPKTIGVSNVYKVTGTQPISIYLIRKRWEFLGHILRMDEETPANKAMRIFYAKKIPEDEATRQEANRIRPSGRPFKNLPTVLKEEFKELTVEDRFTLTRIGTKSIDELSNQEELNHLRNLARQGQHQEEHGVKWKKLVDKIVEANTKKWVSREAKNYTKRHAERRTEEQEIQLWPIFTVRRGRNKKR